MLSYGNQKCFNSTHNTLLIFSVQWTYNPIYGTVITKDQQINKQKTQHRKSNQRQWTYNIKNQQKEVKILLK